jgi:acyl transferase domain-containing protein
MSKTAFLFPGQGSQFAGMGQTLAHSYPEARRVFEEADAALGFSLSKLCFEGPEEQLWLTENTQPAMLAVSVAALAVLRGKGVTPDYVAGHSLGEYSALVAAGSLDFGAAVQLVLDQSASMGWAAGTSGATRLAVLKDAASLFTTLIQKNNGIGIIRFDQDAYPPNDPTFGGMAITKVLNDGFGDPTRIAAAGVIAAHGAHGDTSVGDGLEMGLGVDPPRSDCCVARKFSG